MQKLQTAIYFTITFLLSSSFASAQNFKVIAAEDGAALPFATLINYTHPNLVSANANGIAALPVQIGDSIAVSYIGFKTTAFIFNSNTTQTIHLLKETNLLPRFTVVNCKKMKKLKYGNTDSINFKIMANGEKTYFGGVSWNKGPWENGKFAVWLNPEIDNGILKEFSFWLKKPFNAPNSSIYTPLILSIYDVEDSNFLPGNLISESPVFYFPKKEGKQTIKMDSMRITIPPNGIYVCFQYVRNEEVEWKIKTHLIDSAMHIDKDTILTYYGVNIAGNYSRNFNLMFFNPTQNKWFSPYKTPHDNNIHGTIKCEAIIKRCDD